MKWIFLGTKDRPEESYILYEFFFVDQQFTKAAFSYELPENKWPSVVKYVEFGTDTKIYTSVFWFQFKKQETYIATAVLK